MYTLYLSKENKEIFEKAIYNYYFKNKRMNKAETIEEWKQNELDKAERNLKQEINEHTSYKTRNPMKHLIPKKKKRKKK